MYCNKCGNDNQENSMFCSKCGAKISTAVISQRNFIVPEITQISPEAVNSIYNLIAPLKEIAELNNKIASTERFQKYYQSKVKNAVASYIIGSILGILAAIVIIPLWGVPFLLRVMIGAVVGLGLSIIFVESFKKSVRENEVTLNKYISRIDEVCEGIDEDEIKLLPPDYRYYQAANFFYNAFINQRALTMQQAVNLYEDEKRKDQMARIQQQQMQHLASIRTSSAVSATMSTLNFVHKIL